MFRRQLFSAHHQDRLVFNIFSPHSLINQVLITDCEKSRLINSIPFNFCISILERNTFSFPIFLKSSKGMPVYCFPFCIINFKALLTKNAFCMTCALDHAQSSLFEPFTYIFSSDVFKNLIILWVFFSKRMQRGFCLSSVVFLLLILYLHDVKTLWHTKCF